MRRAFAARIRAIAALVPSGVATALSVGAWLALTAVFTVAGNVVLLTAVTTMGESLGPALILLAVVGVFGTPAVSLALARTVVAGAVQRVESAVVREDPPTPDGACETDERGRCRPTQCC